MDLALETHPATVREETDSIWQPGVCSPPHPPNPPLSRKRKLGHTGAPRWQEAQGHVGRGQREVPSVGQSWPTEKRKPAELKVREVQLGGAVQVRGLWTLAAPSLTKGSWGSKLWSDFRRSAAEDLRTHWLNGEHWLQPQGSTFQMIEVHDTKRLVHN